MERTSPPAVDFKGSVPNHLRLQTVPLDRLFFADRKLRKHPASQIRKIARSLETFGCRTGRGVHRPALQRSDLRTCLRAGPGAAPRVRHGLHLLIQGVFATLNNGDRPSAAPYLEALAFALETAALAPGGRLLVAMPPRHPKSISALVLDPESDPGGAQLFRALSDRG